MDSNLNMATGQEKHLIMNFAHILYAQSFIHLKEPSYSGVLTGVDTLKQKWVKIIKEQWIQCKLCGKYNNYCKKTFDRASIH